MMLGLPPIEPPKDFDLIALLVKALGVLWVALVGACTLISRNLLSRLKALEADSRTFVHKADFDASVNKLERHVDMRADRVEDRMDSQFKVLLDRIDKK